MRRPVTDGAGDVAFEHKCFHQTLQGKYSAVQKGGSLFLYVLFLRSEAFWGVLSWLLTLLWLFFTNLQPDS